VNELPTPLTGTITIHNAVFYAYHGVSDGEQAVGAQFELDVEMTADIAPAAASDVLADTLNYESVYAELQHIVTSRKYKLLETLAAEIVAHLFRHQPRLLGVAVRVRKPNAPVKGVVKSVELSLALTRTQYEQGAADRKESVKNKSGATGGSMIH